MAELRYNPLLNDWIIIASHRQDRPQMPKDWCPFCPGSGKVPDSYDVYKYDNDFPALSQNPPVPDDVATDFFKVKPEYGKCEVVLYSPEHTTTLPQLSVDHIEKLVSLWQERFTEISKDENIKYIFMFENKGEPVGVTMPHPHGQIYGYSVIPKRINEELSNSKKHFENTGKCLICDILENEYKEDKRVICENEDFAVILPFFSDYPYGIYIISKKHKQNITEFNDAEKHNLAKILKEATGT
ncbi:MAG: galactose-1-phosphate uridylyltransferase, partial [Clostridia bacterium]|nr:galactose-1-phosphate uridylyltransferase [Clostridia bacterium]